MHQGNDSIPEHVRAQLLAMGIPSAKHTRAHLTDCLPDDLNIDAAGLAHQDALAAAAA